MRASYALTGSLLVLASGAVAQEVPPPIIDVHFHAQPATSQGPPPLGMCFPVASWPTVETGAAWPEAFLASQKDPPCADPFWSAETDEELMKRSLDIAERRNVIGITSGALTAVWQQRAPDRIIPGLLFSGGPGSPSADELRQDFLDGEVQVLSEVTIQYRGVEPADPTFEPYLALAEELDVPVGIHIGTGPPGAPYLGFSGYRARLHSPLILDDVLVRHPDLRLYVMHSGWPMLDDMLALMWTHPQVYVGVGVIGWGLPRTEFHRYLRRLVEAGFGRRIMFGSDQMVWPDALEVSIQSIETADFLTAEQKRDILYNNAARFLRLSDEQIAKHHGRP